MGKFALGQAVSRTEDPRLLRGGGQYVDDLRLPRECHAYMLRSPHAHARILGIDCAIARNMPGVLAVYTGADWLADGLGQHTIEIPRAQRDGSPQFCPTRHAIEPDTVRMVGDIVAMIVAETVNLAKDAAESIVVDYEPLPVLIDGLDARKAGAPVLHQGCSDNESYFYAAGDKVAVDATIVSAHHVTRVSTRLNRVTPNTMEPRNCIGQYDARFDRHILYAAAQLPHMVRKQSTIKIRLFWSHPMHRFSFIVTASTSSSYVDNISQVDRLIKNEWRACAAHLLVFGAGILFNSYNIKLIIWRVLKYGL